MGVFCPISTPPRRSLCPFWRISPSGSQLARVERRDGGTSRAKFCPGRSKSSSVHGVNFISTARARDCIYLLHSRRRRRKLLGPFLSTGGQEMVARRAVVGAVAAATPRRAYESALSLRVWRPHGGIGRRVCSPRDTVAPVLLVGHALPRRRGRPHTRTTARKPW